jgi:hypothetical protein
MERINGEIISGIALAMMAILFIYAAQVNSIWTVALPASYLLVAVGAALIGLGLWTRRNNNRHLPSREEHSHH